MFGRQWNLEEILCGPYIDESFFYGKSVFFILKYCKIVILITHISYKLTP